MYGIEQNLSVTGDGELAARSRVASSLAGCPVPRRETLSGFGRYQTGVMALPLAEQQRLRRLARIIRASFRPGCQPIASVQLVGHADRDLSRGPTFEKRISLERAKAVKGALRSFLKNPALSSRISWQVSGAGATQLLFPRPGNEAQRARNRRVEVIMAAKSPSPQGWEKAIQENRRFARALGWQSYATALMRLLGFVNTIPNETTFAAAVSRWQQARNLPHNGIVGTQTLARMRAALQSMKFFPGDDPRPTVSSQEIPPDPSVLRHLEREFQHEAGAESDKFVTEQVFGFPEGHKHLTELAAAVLPITTVDLDALKEGVARVDELAKAFDPPEQRRHTLRRFKCQPVADALSEARNHFVRLHSMALGTPGRGAQFELFGECLHLLQDSYSTAHTERQWSKPGGVHPIIFIRFFGFHGSCTFPLEHRVVPPPDPRDTIKAGGALTPFAREAVLASREYLSMALRHRGSPGSPAISRELHAFMDKHLLLSPSHTRTTFCYPACPDPNAPCRCR